MRFDLAVLWRAQCAAVVLGGTWVALDTWSGFPVVGHMWVDVIVGAVAIAVGFSVGHCRHWCGFIVASLGIWLSMAAFNPGLVVDPGIRLNNLIVGPLLAIAGLAAVVFVEAPDRERERSRRRPPDLRLVTRLQRRGLR
jgi:hypothetical protein